jgi:hypothetical protein
MFQFVADMADILRKLLGRDAEILMQFLGIPNQENSYRHTGGQTQFHNNIKRSVLDNIQQLDDAVTMDGMPDMAADIRILGKYSEYPKLCVLVSRDQFVHVPLHDYHSCD